MRTRASLVVVGFTCYFLTGLLGGVAQATEVCHPWGTATHEGSGTINGSGSADIIVGSSGVDTIYAGGGDDVICGRGGNDIIYGEDGNDIIYGEDDDDILDGGPGDDTFTYADQWGEDGDDTLVPDSGTDVINLYEKRSRAAVNIDTTSHDTSEDSTDETIPAGTVVIRYSEGTDDEDTDTIEFDDGGDVVEIATLPGAYGDVENGDNFFWGDSTTPRTDQVGGSHDSDHIFGYGGNDFLWGDDPTGGPPPGDYWANDEIDGGAGSYNEIQGGWGDDILTGGSGVDWIWANEGHDTLIGNGDGDYLVGGWIVPWQDDDTATDGDILDGGDGADEIWGGNYQNYVMDDDEDIAVDFGDAITGGDGNDTIDGGPGNDDIDGGDANDTIDGNDGDDTVEGGNGDDTNDGGSGTDTASYANAGSGVVVDLELQGASQDTVGADEDTLDAFESLTGSPYPDDLGGDDYDNEIRTLGAGGAEDIDSVDVGDGVDSVFGGASMDLITVGVGDKTLYGEGGTDFFYLYTGSDTSTLYMDGGPGNDVVRLEDATDPEVDLWGGAGSEPACEENEPWNVDMVYDRWLVPCEDDGDSSIESFNSFSGDDAIMLGDVDNNGFFTSGGNDTFDGRTGNDQIYGMNGNDTITGGEGDDILVGWSGVDSVDGGDGSDTLYANEFSSGNTDPDGSLDALGGGNDSDTCWSNAASDHDTRASCESGSAG